MTLVRFDLGQTADVLSPAEHRGQLRGELQDWDRARATGRKWMHLPPLQGAASSGTLLIGHAAPVCGPMSGYIWTVTRLVVTGLTTGTSPDVVNFFLNDSRGGAAPVWWQLNGNSFGETFGRGQLLVMPGETVICRSLGTFAATGTITVTGDVEQVPAEMQGRLT
jgi:hypothetical protein